MRSSDNTSIRTALKEYALQQEKMAHLLQQAVTEQSAEQRKAAAWANLKNFWKQ